MLTATAIFQCRKTETNLENTNKMNEKLIKQLREGTIALKYDGTLDELKKVLKYAFPLDNSLLLLNFTKLPLVPLIEAYICFL